jgi:hypothetical protein
MINREVRTSLESKLEFLRNPQYSTYRIHHLSPSTPLLLHCIAIPPTALRLASYYTYLSLFILLVH